jgi:aspartyl-tRNA(Asn)/glutamyl-tRNA(Gln) amidotransferase subunit A
VSEVIAETELADLSAVDLLQGYASKAFSPVEVHEAVQRRIEVVEPIIAALWAADPEASAAAARRSEARWRALEPVGALDGVPITIKDNIATRGIPVPSGTAATVLEPAVEDAPPAARAAESGAVLLGKTTMPDLGMLSSGLSSFHRLTRNPWNTELNPGGSSAGGAAAAAAGYGPLHLGTDIGGSLRLPASWTGIVTLKPSAGRIPIDPPYFGRVAGPMTRTVPDAALLMSVLSEPDRRDYMSLPPQRLDWSLAGARVTGLRVGVLFDAGCGLAVDPEVRDSVAAAARLFAEGGAVVEEVTPFVTAEMLADIDLFWRVRAWEWFSKLSHERQGMVLPYIADWSRGGADVPGVVLMRCVNRMLEVASATVRGTADYDLVLSPASPVAAFDAHWASPVNDVTRALEHIAFTMPYNMSGQPASSINCGWTQDGRCIGLQIAGPRFGDVEVLRATAWYEQARGSDVAPVWPAAAVRNRTAEFTREARSA